MVNKKQNKMNIIYLICDDLEAGKKLAMTMPNPDCITVITPEDGKLLKIPSDFPHWTVICNPNDILKDCFAGANKKMAMYLSESDRKYYKSISTPIKSND